MADSKKPQMQGAQILRNEAYLRYAAGTKKAAQRSSRGMYAMPSRKMDMEENKPYFLNVRLLRTLLIAADDIMHFTVASVLILCAAIILVRTLPNLLHADTTGILHVLNDVLLTLIVMELVWPIVRFLKRKPFSLNPFLYIGIISSTRRILMLEAEHSMLAKLNEAAGSWQNLWPMLAELGANVAIILILAVAIRLVGVNNPASE